MTGSMKIGKLKKNAAYYYQKDYDERVGGQFVFFIVPLKNNDGQQFYYVKSTSDGNVEISGETYIITEERLTRYIREAKSEIDGQQPLYFWLDENGETIKKTYL